MLTPSGRFQPDRKICFSMSDFHPGSWNPAWSVATILTGLLSFMLSDEMTTGSVTTSDADKRAYAVRSHAWNLEQRRFKEAFPDYCTPAPRDVPNMAQKELGSSSKPPPQQQTATPVPARITSSTPIPTPVIRTSSGNGPLTSGSGAVTPTGDSTRAAATGWTAMIRQMVWEKWRWGVVLALAVIVSRMSSA
ncbi:hypothetical protein QCA50_008876 [Cerrena zonata]|uniref:UBC core domain-containing protein n=1 Tax=Cerrena zonata TaxID=2478898 RepID=A0AAW0GDG2_9APHY